MSVDRQLVDDCSVLGVNLTPEWDDEEESERQIEAKSDDASISSDIPIERYNDSSFFSFVFSVGNLILLVYVTFCRKWFSTL